MGSSIYAGEGMSLFDLDEPLRKVSRGDQLRRTGRENAKAKAEQFYHKARARGVAEYEHDKQARVAHKLAQAKAFNKSISKAESRAAGVAKSMHPAKTFMRWFRGKKTKGMGYF